jgi:hypothetical protein
MRQRSEEHLDSEQKERGERSKEGEEAMLYPKAERAREGGSARASRGCPKGDALA